jgi:SAM-dependent methyltransferase
MDANDLKIPVGIFDAVLCRWGLMFVDDLVATLCQLHSVLKSGGRISISVWASADEVPSLSLAARVVHDTLGLPAPNELWLEQVIPAIDRSTYLRRLEIRSG